MSSDDSPRFMKSTGRSVTAFRGGNISRRTLRLSRVRSETPCSSLRRCADKKAALLVRRAAWIFLVMLQQAIYATAYRRFLYAIFTPFLHLALLDFIRLHHFAEIAWWHNPAIRQSHEHTDPSLFWCWRDPAAFAAPSAAYRFQSLSWHKYGVKRAYKSVWSPLRRRAYISGYQLYPFRACEKGRTTTHKL